MSAYSSAYPSAYATANVNFFPSSTMATAVTQNSHQLAAHSQHLVSHEPMIFHPAPTYYASSAQELINYPPALPSHSDTTSTFSYYQPNVPQPWTDVAFDANYSNTSAAATTFDYLTSISVSTTSTNNLKHWSTVDQFAPAPLLSSTNDMLVNFPPITSVATNSTSVHHLSSTILSVNNNDANTDFLGQQRQQHYNNSAQLATSSTPQRLKRDLKRLAWPPQTRALNMRQLQLQNLGTKVFSCTQCNRQYCRKSTLKAHMKQHIGGKRQFVCDCCGKTFTQAANLTAHQRVHTGEKPFACSICLRPFSQSSSLITHRRTHTGERPYPCPHCVKSFTDSSTLTKHMRTHTGIKPYSCNLCMMCFSQSGNLHRHMKTHRAFHSDH